MSSSISAIAPAAATDTSAAAEQAALTKLQNTYAADIQSGQTPLQLQSLAQQIVAAAAAIGQTVNLAQPTPPASATTTAVSGAMPPGYA